jgi:hypothetical protein
MAKLLRSNSKMSTYIVSIIKPGAMKHPSDEIIQLLCVNKLTQPRYHPIDKTTQPSKLTQPRYHPTDKITQPSKLTRPRYHPRNQTIQILNLNELIQLLYLSNKVILAC